MALRRILSGLGIISLGAALITPPANASGILFTIGGSTQMYTLGNLMAQKYQSAHTDINISVLPSTSQRGFDYTCSGATAVGMSDVYIQDNQLAETGCQDMVAIPVAVSSTPVVYNLPGAYFKALDARIGDGFTLQHPVRLTADIMAAIYSGTIRKWNDAAIARLNPGMALPAQLIRTFNSAEPGGSGFVFDQWLALSVPSWNKAVGVSMLPGWPVGFSTGTQSSGDMVQKIASTPYSIGFVGFDFAISNHLQAAALKNASGTFLTPSLNGLSKAIAYQLSNPRLGMPRDFRRPFVTVPGADAFNPANFEFFLVHHNLKAFIPDNPARRQAIKAFLQWCVADTGGQQFIESIALRKVGGASKPELAHGFVPVPPEIRAVSKLLVDSIAI